MNRFSQIYCKSSLMQQDSSRFRVRFAHYATEKLNGYKLSREIAKTLGAEVIYSVASNTVYYDNNGFIKEASIQDVLDTITIVHSLLIKRNNHYYISSDEYFYGTQHQQEFRKFINTCFAEENLCYQVNENGIVHYNPDEEFNNAKRVTLKCLEASRYQAVAKEFNLAYQKLDVIPPDTKGAIKAIFECLEILCKLITGKSGKTSLSESFIRNTLKPILNAHYNNDQTAKNSVSDLLNSFGQWVNGMHWYRHGQNIHEPNDPPLELAIFAISTGAAYLRWLVEIDTKLMSVEHA